MAQKDSNSSKIMMVLALTAIVIVLYKIGDSKIKELKEEKSSANGCK